MNGFVKGSAISNATAVILLAGLTAFSAWRFVPRADFPIYPSSGLTKVVKLSDYFAPIKGTRGDADIYVFDSGKPGGTAMAFGGTHNDEPAGALAAIAMLENLKVTAGRVFIVARANSSGVTHTTQLEGFLDKYSIDTPSGKRWFRFGSRYSNPIDQWPDPDIFVHKPSGQRLAGEESRNLNRVWPGRPNGTFTEKIAHAYIQLLKKENVDVAVDMHEAQPEYFLINAICYPEKSSKIAMTTDYNLSMADLDYTMEASPPNLHGFFHREIANFTDTRPFLMETPNPSQGRFHGAMTNDLIVTGKDPLYVQAGKLKRLFVPMTDAGWPMSVRTARHIKGFQEIVNALGEVSPARKIVMENVPEYKDIVKKGIGAFLHAPATK